jgi:cobaltochelatase CobT
MARAKKNAAQAATTNSQALKGLLFPGKEGRNLLTEAKALDAALPLIAQGLVDQSGHQIRLARQHGPGACTDGTTIYLMDAVAPKSSRDEESYLLFVALKMGLLHHELGHVNHTDFSLPRAADGLTCYLENLFEDIRQEKVHCATVRTGRTYIEALGMAMIDAGIDTPAADDASPTEVFTSFLYTWLRVEVSGEYAYRPQLDIARAQMQRTFDQAFITHCEAMLPRAATLASTLEAMHLAEDFRALLEQEAANRQQQQSSGQNAGGAAGGSSNPSGQSGQAGQGDSQSDASASGQDSSGNSAGMASGSGGSGASGHDPNASPGADGQGQDDATDGSAPQAGSGAALQAIQDLLDGKDVDPGAGSRDGRIRQVLDAVSQTLQNNGAQVIEVDLASIQAATQPQRSLQTGLSVDLDEGASIVTRLQAQLRQQLFAETRTRTGRAANGTRLDPKRLHHVAFGDPRIFRTTHRGRAVDTAIVLLADVSGSMGGNRIILADQALFATACALEALPGIAVSVATFPGNQLVLPFGVRARRERDRFTLRSFGGTPMHEGIMMANRMLQLRKEPRKLLVVLTDGEPDCGPTSQAAISVSNRMGIEVYGLGIQTTAVERYFTNSQVINNVNDLPTALFGLLRSRLSNAA